MDINQQLIDEVQLQLEDDILHLAWLVQLVHQMNPSLSDLECVDTVVDLVARLHGDATIVIGNARQFNEIVLIDAWPESEHNLRDRIKSAIDESSDRDRDFCFWIQLSKHFARS